MPESAKMVLAIVIALGGCVSGGIYLVNTLRGKTQPNRITWFFWSAPIIGAVASITEGFSWNVLAVLMAGVVPCLVFFASFVNKKAYWKIKPADYVCGVFAAIALVFYFVFHNAVLTIIFAILTDGIASIPTIIKSARHPESETKITFLIALCMQLLNLLCISGWVFTNYAFSFYLIAVDLVLVIVLYFPRSKQTTPVGIDNATHV